MKKLAFLIFGLLWLSTAHATDFYFDTTATGVTTPCSIGTPCENFPSTTLDGTNGLACGDTLNFKRGQTDTGSAAAIIIQSGTSSCVSNPIKIRSYGSGANHIFASDTVYGGTWTSTGANNIYYTDTGSGNVKGYAMDDSTTLYQHNLLNNSLIAGSFCPSSSTTAGTACSTTGQYVFVRLSDGTDPTSSEMRIGNYQVGDAFRGLIKGPTGANRGTYGQYIDVHDITVLGSSGMGITPNGPRWRLIGVQAKGARREGMCPIMYATGNESADGTIDYYGYYEGNSANGNGFGQNVTVYAPNVTFVGTFSTLGAMAGFDILDYGADVEPDNFVCLRCVSTNNGRSPHNSGFDPNVYVDGADHWLFWGTHIYNVGLSGSNGQTNGRQGFKFGSEHPTTEIVTDGYFVNNFIMGAHSFGFKADNLNQGDPDNMENIVFDYNTIFSNAGTSGDRNFHFDDMLDTADTLHFYNNILVGNSGTVIDDAIFSGQALNADYNMLYRRTQTSSSTNIFSIGGTSYTLATWRTLSGEDANSIYDDPEITTDSSTVPDVHLQGTSPAINAGSLANACTIQSLTWVDSNIRTDIGNNCVRGEAVAGTEDDVAANPDMGFHFSAAQLTSTNITPVDFSTGTVGTATVTFTMPEKVTALLYDWKIQVEFPAGFALSSGSTTAIGNITGFDGTVTTDITGQKLTFTRVGDGTSTLPTTVSFTLSNIKNPTSAGSGGTYKIKLVDPRTQTQTVYGCNGVYEAGLGCIQAQDTGVSEDTFTTSQSTPPRLQCSGTRINFSGKVFL